MKELTYLHCQNIRLDEVSNNFYCYLKKHPGTPNIFIILDHQDDKLAFIEKMELLVDKVKSMPIIVSDIKD